MLAKAQPDVPTGEGWLYEPKWDGFRCIVFIGCGIAGEHQGVHLASRNGQPLQRYFPELLAPLTAAFPDTPVAVDGEIVVAGERGLDFDLLGQRIHPAASRVARLAAETPARFVAFDVLMLGGRDVRAEPFRARRAALIDAVRANPSVGVTPQTDDADVAREWFTRYEGAGLDGVVAKRADQVYRPGDRVMVKVKHKRTVDCVVGGFRRHAGDGHPGSLLLGLHDAGGVLHFVGHTASFTAAQRRELEERLAPLTGGESFSGGRSPGGPSRWTRDKDMAWIPVDPQLVCEVAFDHMQGERMRHAATFLRWRPDKPAAECTLDQLQPPHPFSLDDVVRFG